MNSRTSTRDRGVVVWRCRICGNVICPARAVDAIPTVRLHLSDHRQQTAVAA